MEQGYDPAFGARPLKRTIQQRIENPLALEMIAGKFVDGDTIRVDADAHGFVLRRWTRRDLMIHRRNHHSRKKAKEGR